MDHQVLSLPGKMAFSLAVKLISFSTSHILHRFQNKINKCALFRNFKILAFGLNVKVNSLLDEL